MGVWDMIRQAAAGNMPGYVYHGHSVRLPPQVHAIVHDQSLPEHVRGFHLARHLLTGEARDNEIPHSGHQLGQDWHRDSYWASLESRGQGGIPAGRTPYVLKALAPHPDHVLSEDSRKGHPMLLHAGSPVHFTGLFWHDPDDERNGGGELQFPEPITARA